MPDEFSPTSIPGGFNADYLDNSWIIKDSRLKHKLCFLVMAKGRTKMHEDYLAEVTIEGTDITVRPRNIGYSVRHQDWHIAYGLNSVISRYEKISGKKCNLTEGQIEVLERKIKRV